MNGSTLDGRQGDSITRMQSIDGRYVVFVSNSQNLVASGIPPTDIQQVYRYDRLNHEVLLVSVALDGVTCGNGKSDSPTINADGSRVSFRSESTNLSGLDQDNFPDLYVREIGKASVTALVSVPVPGVVKQPGYFLDPRISANGRRVVFTSYGSLDPRDNDGFPDVYVRDLELQATILVSVSADGFRKANNTSQGASISADGTRIAFSSLANNLDTLDQDTRSDIYVRELDETPTTYLVSMNSAGTEKGNGSSGSSMISADGHRIVFESGSTNLDPLDRDAFGDIYVRTLTDTPSTLLVNVNASGTWKGNSGGYVWPYTRISISADGTRIAFMTLAKLDPLDQDGLWDIYVRDIGAAPTTFLASVDSSGTTKGNRSSYYPILSDDGTRVAFASESSNLDPLDTDTNFDVYIRELDATPRTILASPIDHEIENDHGSSSYLSISGDGTQIAFASDGSNLVPNDFNQSSDVIVYSVDAERLDLASRTNPIRPSTTSGSGASLDSNIPMVGLAPTNTFQHMWSADGRYLVFLSTAANLVTDIDVPEGIQQVYRYDQLTHQTVLVSVDVNGTVAGNGTSESATMSADGLRVSFRSLASNLHPLDTDNISDIFVREFGDSPTTQLVSVNANGTAKGNGYSSAPIISANGTRIAFESSSTNLDPKDIDSKIDVYVRDLIAPFQTILISVSDDGNTKGNSDSGSPSISADGNRIAFSSSSSNLHRLDMDFYNDIYVRELGISPRTLLASVNATGDIHGGFSGAPAISADGKRVAFLSGSTVLDPRDKDSHDDVYVRVLEPVPTTILASRSDYTASNSVSISDDGMRVAFATENRFFGYSDIYVRELDGSDRIILVTVNADGTQRANEGGVLPRISADGKRVVYISKSINLDPLDKDRLYDVYVRELDVTPATYLLSINQDGTAKGNANSTLAAISPDGSRVAFVSLASNLVPGDWNGKNDVFIRELPPHRWQNPKDHFDVNDDGIISPLDVLALVNDINQFSTRILPSETPSGPNPPPYLDVDGDDFVSPLDVLVIINHINAKAILRGIGEGELRKASSIESEDEHRTKLIDDAISEESWREKLVPGGVSHRRRFQFGMPMSAKSDSGGLLKSYCRKAV